MTVFLVVLGGYLAVVVLFIAFQERLIFPGAFRSDPSVAPDRDDVVYGTVELPSGAEVRTVTAGPMDAEVWCLGFMGNNERIGAATAMAVAMVDYGVRSMFVEHPGYGRSGGEASFEGFLVAAEAAGRQWRAAASDRPITAFGASLGTFSAVKVASLGLADRVLLAAPPASMVRVSRDRYPWLPVKPFLRHRFDSEVLAPAIRCPLLIIHGDQDRTVPFAHGQLLAELWGGPATLVRAAGHGHNDLDLSRSGPFGDRIAGFLR